MDVNRNNKIAVLTLSASDNCGSLLQTYALQTILQKHCDIEIINFESRKSKEVYDILPFNIIFHPRKFIYTLLNIVILLKQKKEYNDFRKEFLNLTKRKYKSEKELLKVNDKYKTIVVGSDQVWNVEMKDFDESFFLYWAKKSKKVAYAPSLGKGKIDNYIYKKKLSDNFNSFSAISVREITGKKEIEKYYKKNIPILVDPTLLLKKNEYEKIIQKRNITGKYIFYYSWSYNNKNLKEIVSKYAKQYNLPVYVIDARKWIYDNPKKYNFKLYHSSGPQTFLNLMKFCELAFVESFHGSIFAYIFEKKFYFLNSLGNGKIDKRIDAILTLLNKKECVVNNYDDINKDISNCLCDNYKLKTMVTKSYEFIKKYIYE